ncbi:DUF2280 domain-containing protein [Caballeronia grimmiae]|uniref:DUF2280 domain-containing protein n=1 Tax=Caballeronia grimmiae TaxID=1071679 RepID=UPI0038B859E3
MPVLKKVVKTFIVRALARYHSPTEVVAMVKETYGLDVSTSQVVTYNPKTFMGRSLSREFVDLFEAERKNFLECEQEIGISQRAVRLRELDDELQRAKKRQEPRWIIKTLEAAAKEVGAYWNAPSQQQASGPIVVFNAPQVPDGVDAQCNQLQSPAEGSGDA